MNAPTESTGIQENSALSAPAMIDPIVAFFTDYPKAKLEFPKLKRTRTVTVRTKTGGQYQFAYAPAEEIAKVDEPLARHGFTLFQREVHRDGAAYVETTLAHKGGHAIYGLTKILTMENGPQAYGSSLTYARRYGKTLLLDLVTDDDDDGNAAEGNTVTTNGKSNYHDPRGEKWTKQDTVEVNKYHKRILSAIESSNDDEALAAWQEACEDHDFGIAVWATLPKPIQAKIKDLKDSI